MKLRNIEEVFNKIIKTDVFGLTINDAFEFMPFHIAKKYLDSNFLAEIERGDSDWNYKEYTPQEVIKNIKEYIPFAWEKANRCRGLSANRSIQHFHNWFYMFEDEEFEFLADTILDYEYYGKPWLYVITELVGLNPKEFDNGEWTNDEINYISENEIKRELKKAYDHFKLEELKNKIKDYL